MTIASALTSLNTDIVNARTAITNKGGTVTLNGGSSQLANDIATIPTGGGGGIGIPREVKNGVYQLPSEDFTFSLPSGVTNIGDYCLAFAFYSCNTLVGADFSSLLTIGGTSSLSYAFQSCPRLTSVVFSSLTTVSGTGGCSNVFYGCTGLTTISFPSLATITGFNAFYYAFVSCRNLTNVYFPALTTTSFGSNTNQFSGMMASTGSNTTHTIHFPSNLQTTISGLNGYPLFGGTSGYVVLAFDQPATS